MTTNGQPHVFVRPQPSKHDAERIAQGKSKANPGSSSSWFTKGALEAGDGAMWLIDADGARHPLPLPPIDGTLCCERTTYAVNGNVGIEIDIFIADGQSRRVVDLPCDGFEGPGLAGLAAAAGLRYTSPLNQAASPKTDTTLNLRKASIATTDRHHFPHLFGPG